MLRKFAYKKIFRTTGMLFLFIMLLLFPVSKEYSLEEESNLKNVSKVVNQSEIFLLDKNGYVSRCLININYGSDEESVKKIVETLINGGKYEDKIPNGFNTIIPSDTKINDVTITDDNITVDLSDDILQISDEKIKKALELLTYNLTNIKGINSIYIKIDGKILERYPNGNKIIKQPLKRADGVNEVYDVNTYKDASKTTIYYVSKNNKGYYYVPVTKVNNDNREKIRVIVDELTSSNIYETNLMSFLNYNTKLNNYKIDGNVLTVDFNNFLFDDVNTKSILEEVIYSISLSVRENYDVEEVVFTVDGEEITKSVLKNIE